MRGGRRIAVAIALAAGLPACAGQQSALEAHGQEAASTLVLTWVMIAGAALILAFVCVAIAVSILGPNRARKYFAGETAVFGWGFIFPVVTLTTLLVVGLAMLRSGPAASAGGLQPAISVSGEQWWWRVTYDTPSGPAVTANELIVPVGQTVRLTLTSPDVIHSLWIPSYAGKVDMIPGHANTMTLRIDRPGRRRGQCAEYCGGAHALMSLDVIALEPADYERRIAALAALATSSRDLDGEALFLRSGCAACHAVRGTAARGETGPDLTHVASRSSIGAGILPADREGFAAWIDKHPDLKPDTHMPAFDFLSGDDVSTLAGYLASLE